jgi:hypothetical protein
MLIWFRVLCLETRGFRDGMSFWDGFVGFLTIEEWKKEKRGRRFSRDWVLALSFEEDK